MELTLTDGYVVRFTDYGNEDVVTDKDIVLDIKMIPVTDVIDECVQTQSEQEDNITAVTKSQEFQINQEVIAKWLEDNTWYRAVILNHATNVDNLNVRFLDYGNEDDVALSDIVLDISMIPEGDFIDENLMPQIKESIDTLVATSINNQESSEKIIVNNLNTKDVTKPNVDANKTLSSVILEAEKELEDELKAAVTNNSTVADYNMTVPIDMLDLTNNNVTLPLYNTLKGL